MNPYYLTDSLGYNFGNGYSSGSGTSSPAGLVGVSNGASATAASNNNSKPATSAPPSGPASASTSAPPSGPGSVAAMPPTSNQPSATSGPLVHPHQDLNEFLESFWTRQMDGVERETPDFKTYNLPLARIKKVMKSDEEVKMISAEAPIMFSKACEIFISELTCRAWLVAEGHKRRTLQKSDVAAAIAFSDVFDFLIDIVPRDGDEPPATAAQAAAQQANSNPTSNAGSTGPAGGAQANHVSHHPHHHQQQHAQHHQQHAQHHHSTFDDDAQHHGHQWQAADGEYDEHKDVYDGYDEGRDGEALYSEYVQGEGEAFG